MSALNFNKEEEITLVIHTNTHPSILKLIQKQKMSCDAKDKFMIVPR